MFSNRFTIFHTNDIHGRTDQLSRLAGMVRYLRMKEEAEGTRTFFFDAGDSSDRLNNICGITKCAAFTGIMNAAGYNLQTMGNAISLPYGIEAASRAAEKADYPILAANLRNKSGPLPPGFSEYILLPVTDRINIGVTGLTAPWKGMYEFFGYHLPDFIEEAKRQVEKLKKEGVTIIIVLSHLGLEDDRKLAGEVPGIALIIGGHSHTLLEKGERCGNTLITQAGCYAEGVGRIDISLDPETGNIDNIESAYIRVPETAKKDRLVDAAVSGAEAEALKISGTEIGYLKKSLDLDYFRECGIGNLGADALKFYMKADAAIVLSGLFNASLSAGRLTLGDLNIACFTGANPCVSRLTGREILEALEGSLDPDKMKAAPKSFRGAPVGILQVSGLKILYTENNEGTVRIKNVEINGRKVVASDTYRLAHTDAETSNSGSLKIGDPGNTDQEVPTILREVIQKYLESESPLSIPEQGRWVRYIPPR